MQSSRMVYQRSTGDGSACSDQEQVVSITHHPYRYRSALISGALHAIGLLWIIGSAWLQPSSPVPATAVSLETARAQPAPAQAATPMVPPVQAALVDSAALEAELHRLAAQDAAKKAEETARLNRIAHKTEQMEKKRQAEEARLQVLKKAQRAAAEKAAAEQAQLKALAAQQQALREKQQAEEKRLQALEAKRVAAEKAAQAEAERQKVAAARKREQELAAAKRAEEKALAAQLAAEAAQLAADQARLQAQNQARQAAELQKYTAALRNKVGQHWLGQGTWQGLETKLAVRLAPGGSVLDVRVVHSSGNMALDRSARAAIYKASPLPVPADPALFASFQEFQFTFRPDDFRAG